MISRKYLLPKALQLSYVICVFVCLFVQTQEEQTKEERKKRKELVHQWKEKEKERVKDGKSPYFLKKCKLKYMVLQQK